MMAASRQRRPQSPGAAPFRLGTGEVHTWCATLDVAPEMSAGFYTTLSLEERNRCARFRFERDRQRFIAAHGVLRELLGHYLGTQPGRIGYVCNAFGKPDLSPESGSRLRFNLSHSAGLALIAIATDANVGVDLEYIQAQSDYAEIAQHFFSADEVDRLSGIPSHLYAEAFISCWTKKEAYVKACGDGLAIPFSSFSVPPGTDPVQDFCVASNDIASARCWSFHTLQPAAGYVGALAIEGSGWRLSQWQWQCSGDSLMACGL